MIFLGFTLSGGPVKASGRLGGIDVLCLRLNHIRHEDLKITVQSVRTWNDFSVSLPMSGLVRGVLRC